MSQNTFTLPILGPRNRAAPTHDADADTDAEASDIPDAETTASTPTVKAPATETPAETSPPNKESVTDPTLLSACKCRSMKSLLRSFDAKLKRTNKRAWKAVHPKYEKDTGKLVFFLQKTVASKSQAYWEVSQWSRSGSYSSWFHRNIASGQNSGGSVKIEIHVTWGQQQRPKENKEMTNRQIARLPLKRLEYSFQETDLVKKTARGKKWAPGTSYWFKGQTDTEANDLDDSDEEDEDKEMKEVVKEEEEEGDAMEIDG
ncbi:uncharacterized protein Z520_00816 [Fonsecaea multimorphosa CBS 102226]|uniref:Uncharacterized protein n=1 Tax=Fonsecaea multimorphosa CBS 102226 TaxID=1442371 RepID=A0A0D2L4X3_9EURO|nr:uncharacterized protein Z520_00816 [Fonsecaea multimorphosa CBS 102226]KIY04124.1 hypothetical protein Z520_00816 [Fonsecaea multimorphosa CBS 102226]